MQWWRRGRHVKGRTEIWCKDSQTYHPSLEETSLIYHPLNTFSRMFGSGQPWSEVAISLLPNLKGVQFGVSEPPIHRAERLAVHLVDDRRHLVALMNQNSLVAWLRRESIPQQACESYVLIPWIPFCLSVVEGIIHLRLSNCHVGHIRWEGRDWEWRCGLSISWYVLLKYPFTSERQWSSVFQILAANETGQSLYNYHRGNMESCFSVTKHRVQRIPRDISSVKWCQWGSIFSIKSYHHPGSRCLLIYYWGKSRIFTC